MRKILTIVVNSMVLFIIAVTVICMIMAGRVSEKQLISPFATFLVVLILVWGASKYSGRHHNGLEEHIYEKPCIKRCLIAAFVVMIYIGANIYYKSGSDPWTIDYAGRVLIGEVPFEPYAEWLKSYYSMYPNNILFTVYYSAVLKIDHAFGFLAGNNSIFLFVIVNCLISCVSVYLIYLVLRQITNIRITIIGTAVSILYFCFNPYNTWIYSDPFALWIPISIVATVVLCKKSSLKWFLVGLLSVLAYNLKPQSVIPVIALLCMVVIDTKKISALSIREIGKLLCCALMGIIISISIVVGSKALFETKIPVDENLKLPMSHWMMMGLNQESAGGWNGDDVDFSASFGDQELAKDGTASIIKERLQTMGLPGYLNFLWKKLGRLCSNGMMDFGTSTGDWFDVVFPERNSKTAPLFRSIYYNDGEYFGFLYTGMNILWYFIILSCLLTAVMNIKKSDSVTTWLGIGILGLFMFELIFEAQARHLYSFLPVFVVYGCLGYLKKVGK